MFSFFKPKSRASGPIDSSITTHLGKESSCSGVLRVVGNCQVDGSFEGTIEVQGTLIITATARVIGESIKARLVQVAGSVKGDITAGRVEILETGRVFGNLLADSFRAAPGGFVRGQVQLSSTETQLAELAVMPPDDTTPTSD